MRAFCRLSSRLIFAAALAALAAKFPSALFAQQSSAVQSAPVQPHPLITQPVDEALLTVLEGNTHPLARPEFDLGTAPATLPMQRMLLVLKRSPEQESALRKLLDDQQDKASPSYHKWLTPEQFGQQFGPTESDMQTITSWLQSHGFQVESTKGRTVLEFSGSASQVKEAFHTSIHKYVVKGEQHWANSSDPSIPTALTPAVAGVLTLHNFLKKPQIRLVKEPVAAKIRPGKSPELTLSGGVHALSPEDYATIYNINPVYAGGSQITIGVVGRSNLYSGPMNDTPGQDVLNFREDFGLYTVGSTTNFQIVLNGPDPGDLGGAEEAEATLDTTWSGAVAYGAMVYLVASASTNTTDGIDLSEVYIIENNFAYVMTESFGSCEAASTSTEAAGYSGLAEQAAAQGISYFVSTGDNGAEGCDDQDSETVATGPVSVNVLASTPFNTAVGGTVFNENGQPSVYWSSTNTNQESALSYIPEDVWNDSCPASTCGSTANIVAGSGGASTFFAKPTWQAGVTGILNDGSRDIPDVSLTASAIHDGYVLCLEGSCVPDAQGQFNFYLAGGTSASAPSFAGIMALVNQQMAYTNGGNPLQGLANYVLYRLAASQNASIAQCNGSSTSGLPASTCIFNDVTVGNNAVPGELNYGLPSADYQAGIGYDMASGLGSVNVTNLVNQWDSGGLASTGTSLLLNSGNSVNVSHGQSVSVNIVVRSTSDTGTPTGDVSLLASIGNRFETESGVVGFFTLSSNGTVVSSTNQLPGGGPYNVGAYYPGNASYFPSSSSLVLVTVTSEPSTTSLSGPYTLDQFGHWTTLFSTPQPFGTPVFVSAAVGGISGVGTPTGTVTFTSSSGSIPNGASSTLNNQGTTSVQSNPFIVNGPTIPFDAGQYSISASYSGDPSFQPSSSKQPVNFTIQSGFFATVPPSQLPVVISAPGSSGSTSVTVSSSTGFSGTITLSCSGLPAGGACQFSPSSIKATGTLTTTPATITVTTTAAAAELLHSPRRLFLAHGLPGLGLLFSVVLIGGPRRRRIRAMFLWLMLLLTVAVPGCGGGSSNSTPPAPPPVVSTPTGSYNVVVTATSGSTTSSTGFALLVQ